MKSISQNEQRTLDQRVKRNLNIYLDELDQRPKTIINDPIKIKRIKATLKKKGLPQLAKEVAIVTSKLTTEKDILDGMKAYKLQEIGDDLTHSEVVEKTKLNVVKIAVEAVQGLNEMVSSRFLYEGARKASTVGRISRFIGPEPIGTGFMISPNLLMTNHHVLDDFDEANGCYIEFDYFHFKDSTRVKSEIFKLLPDLFYHSSSKYDYAIVMVDPISDQGIELSQYGWNRLSTEGNKVEPSDRLNIIHHPRGEHQQISIRKNFVVDIENDDQYVDYVTDTDYGSSGSPVFNDEWKIVALHRGNTTVEEKDKVEFLLSLEEISKDLANEMKNKVVTVNVGIRIEDILNNLKETQEELPKSYQRLISQIFQSSQSNNPDEGLFDSSIKSEELNKNDARNEMTTEPVAQNINIHGGNVTLNISHKIINESIEKPVTNKIKKDINLELYNQSMSAQASIFKALDYVQKAREIPYLLTSDETKTIKEEYYGSLLDRIENLDDKELFDELAEIMQDTFRLVQRFPQALDLDTIVHVESSTPSSYHKARAHIYTRVDLQSDGSLRGIYSGSVIAPEQLMLVDLINSLDNDDYELPKRYKNSDYLNCEHIVPKTYFDRREEGFSDLHHLITADGAVNKFRNKNTFADLSQQGDDGRSRLPLYVQSGGWKKDGYFEPARGKGLVARATLYFIVAHPRFISDKVYSLEQIRTLIEWSNAEPPTDYEHHRNQTIQDVQGNRNPFIDYPEWVDKVDFELGLS